MACSTGAAVAAAAAGRRAVSRILVHDGMRHARPFMQDMVRFVGEDGYGQSIEQFVQLLTPMSTEELNKSISLGRVTINGQPSGPGHILRRGDIVRCRYHKHESPIFDQPVNVTYEDPVCVAVDKPASWIVHPRGPYHRNSLVQVLQDEMAIHAKLVNRLDRVTSGLVLLGKNNHAVQGMQGLFRLRTMRKTYFARVQGKFPAREEESRLVTDPYVYPNATQLLQEIISKEGLRLSTVIADGRDLYEDDLTTHQNLQVLEGYARLGMFDGSSGETLHRTVIQALKAENPMSPETKLNRRIQRIFNGLKHMDLLCGEAHPAHIENDLGIYVNSLDPDFSGEAALCDSVEDTAYIRVNLPLAELDLAPDGTPLRELQHAKLAALNASCQEEDAEGGPESVSAEAYAHTNSFFVPAPTDLMRLLQTTVRDDSDREFRREIEGLVYKLQGTLCKNGQVKQPSRASKTMRLPWKTSATIFRRLSYDPITDTSVVACRPETGRTHQIRVHLAWLGHPIANDIKYGGRPMEENGYRFRPEDAPLWAQELVGRAPEVPADNRAWNYKEALQVTNNNRSKRTLTYAEQHRLAKAYAAQLGWLHPEEAIKLGITDAAPYLWDTPEQRALDVDILRDCYLCDQLRQGAVVRGGYNSDEFQLMSIWLHAFEYRFPDADSVHETSSATDFDPHLRATLRRCPEHLFGQTMRARVPAWARGRLMRDSGGSAL